MAKHPFLSDEWVAAAEEVREGFAGQAPPPAHKVKMNLVITEAPIGDGTVNAHMDTSGDRFTMALGHIDGEDLTVTVDYATARAIFIEGNPQAGMHTFMAGKIQVQGDITKLMAMQSAPADPAATEVAAAVAAITE